MGLLSDPKIGGALSSAVTKEIAVRIASTKQAKSTRDLGLGRPSPNQAKGTSPPAAHTSNACKLWGGATHGNSAGEAGATSTKMATLSMSHRSIQLLPGILGNQFRGLDGFRRAE